MSALDNFESALVTQLHEQSEWLLGRRGDTSPAQSIRCLGALSVRINTRASDSVDLNRRNLASSFERSR